MLSSFPGKKSSEETSFLSITYRYAQAVGSGQFNLYYMVLNYNLRNPLEKCKVFFSRAIKNPRSQATRISPAGG